MQLYITYECRYAKLPFRNTIILCSPPSLSSCMHNFLLSSPVFPGCHLATLVASFLGSTCHFWDTHPSFKSFYHLSRILMHTLPLGSHSPGHSTTWVLSSGTPCYVGLILWDTLATWALPSMNALYLLCH